MNVPEQYQVVALRYRPQQFDSLVGQSHITTALANAITQNRVGHAYLFTGARGVGKTSSARIFAKCLNCEKGPTTAPCNECDICQAVSIGEDVDVLEIDGASNRGIDEIRQLRSNVAVRPSRSRFKIYIIDEVHMLTSQAFNALLKTLEEPPAHVKFIFCTTDPQKIPITVLSRCQRFDFSPVKTEKIADRLREIAQNENVAADDDALQLLARRANGSMRDSQSLLEQLLSFCGEKITVDEVHQLLGTTDVTRIAEIASAMTEKDSAKTLELIHDNLSSGANSGQLADQLLAYFRDMMVTRVGCGEDTLICCSSNETETLAQQGQQLGLDTVLMVVQILDNAVVAMQSSLHARVLLEVAAVKICGLEHLESIGTLIKSLSGVGNVTIGAGQGTAEPSAPKTAAKKNEINNDPPQSTEMTTPVENSSAAIDSPPETIAANVAPAIATASAIVASSEISSVVGNPQAKSDLSHEASNESPGASVAVADATGSTEITPENATSIYQDAITAMGDMTANMAQRFEKVELDRDKMVVTMLDAYNTNLCSKPERKAKIESAIKELTGRSVRIDFVTTTNPVVETVAAKPKLTRIQQIRELQQQPFVKAAIELFDCEISDYYQRQNPK
jgi:DNA polymerase-3 subunit gamma/tau